MVNKLHSLAGYSRADIQDNIEAIDNDYIHRGRVLTLDSTADSIAALMSLWRKVSICRNASQ